MPLLPLLSYAVAASFTPGPNNLMALDGARKAGFRLMRPFVCGVAAGCFGIVLIACLLNLALYRWIPGIKLAMGLLGTAYMLWLAWKIVRSSGAPSGSGQNPIRSVYSLRTGFWLQFVNPKLLMYAVTAVSTFVMPYSLSMLQMLGISLLLGAVALVSSGSWALFGALFQPWLIRHEKMFNLVMALLLIYSAAAVWL